MELDELLKALNRVRKKHGNVQVMGITEDDDTPCEVRGV